LLVEDFLKSQPTEPMTWSILSSGPYIESLNEYFRPKVDSTGVHVFQLPLAQGAMPLISLEDLGSYALWILENPSQSNGMELEIATAHASGSDIAAAFHTTTGKAARYEVADLATFMSEFWSMLPNGQDTKIASSYAGDDDDTLMSYGQNFTAWWNIYQASGGNKGIITRDYELLDRILPGRVKSVEEWMKKTDYSGGFKPLLKDWADRRSERI
jgi:NmrA-like family